MTDVIGRRRRARVVAFAILSAICLAIPIAYLHRVRGEQPVRVPPVIESPVSTASQMPASVGPTTAPLAPAPEPPTRPRPMTAPPVTPVAAPRQAEPRPQPVVFRFTGIGESYGRMVNATLDAPGEVTATPLRCDRVHVGGGQGICLTARRGVFTTYEAILFDQQFAARHRFPLSGIPSRARVSPDGRLAAITVFESGHSYAAGSFSTRTSIVDVERGDMIVPDLEKLSVVEKGAPLHEIDFNFWGVTFARDSNRFYATLGTRGRTYLVEGDLAARAVRILRDGVECPSLSPDNTRIAFKRRIGGTLTAVTWRLAVLRLDTLEEHLLGETRSVDDQAEWLDDETVLYSLPEAASGTAAMDTWRVPADGGGPPRLLAAKAYSLAPIRDRRAR